MTCLRCEGLMVHEKFEDLDGLWSSDHEFTGWRCLNCGAIVDPVIAAHKRIHVVRCRICSGVDNRARSSVIVDGSIGGSSHGRKKEGLP